MGERAESDPQGGTEFEPAHKGTWEPQIHNKSEGHLRVSEEYAVTEMYAAEQAEKANNRYHLMGPKSFEPRKSKDEVPHLDASCLSEFWKGVIGVEREYNTQDSSIQDWKQSVTQVEDQLETEKQGQPSRETAWAQAVNGAKNWQAPGPDGIHAH